jgi:hypothetical protein
MGRNKSTLKGGTQPNVSSGPVHYRAKGNPTQGEGVSALQLQIHDIKVVDMSRSKVGSPTSTGRKLGTKRGRDQPG